MKSVKVKLGTGVDVGKSGELSRQISNKMRQDQPMELGKIQPVTADRKTQIYPFPQKVTQQKLLAFEA